MDEQVRLKAKRKSETPDIADMLSAYQSIGLVFQGGGALGAYQAGVFQALDEAGIEANWLSGVSIGAINAAIIAGNGKGKRLDRLRDFWETISARKIWHFTPDGDVFRRMRNQASSMMTMLSGLPGFFAPHPVNPWLQPPGAPGATSFYDTSELKATLDRLTGPLSM